jgi:RNase adaptor protein for sRNA GlmZ degradation
VADRTLTLISFGYLHEGPPTADLVIDVRRSLRDPAAAVGLLDLDGRDPRVMQAVINTPGARDLLFFLGQFIATHPQGECVVAIGCAGGRHRSAALVEIAAAFAGIVGWPVTVQHRHIHLPRVLRPDDHTDAGPRRLLGGLTTRAGSRG